MIAKCHSVPHGEALTNYTTRNERADIVKTNLLNDGIPNMAMWEAMALHIDRYRSKFSRNPVKNPYFRIEVSPSMDETKGWTREDWRQFTEEFVREMDRQTTALHRFKKGEPKRMRPVKPTNIANSQYFAGVHYDSKSGIPHLHMVVNRIDKDGNLNNDDDICERAMAAAHAINLRRGWKDAARIQQEHIGRISKDCFSVLSNMTHFDLTTYLHGLEEKGYKVTTQPPKDNKVYGYTVYWGNSHYKASQLGVGKNLTVSRLQDTFNKMHQERKPLAVHSQDGRVGNTPRKPAAPVPTYSQPKPTVQKPLAPVKEEPKNFCKVFDIDDKSYRCTVPLSSYDAMKESAEANVIEDVAVDNVMNVAMLLFMNYLDAATSMSESCGGGGGPGSGWGKKDDEDDRNWARRCATQAAWMCKPMRKRSMGR